MTPRFSKATYREFLEAVHKSVNKEAARCGFRTTAYPSNNTITEFDKNNGYAQVRGKGATINFLYGMHIACIWLLTDLREDRHGNHSNGVRFSKTALVAKALDFRDHAHGSVATRYGKNWNLGHITYPDKARAPFAEKPRTVGNDGFEDLNRMVGEHAMFVILHTALATNMDVDIVTRDIRTASRGIG